MSKFAKKTVDRLLRTRNGMVDGKPRILNLDTGKFTFGYAEVNIQATSPFSRVLVNKAWWSSDTDIMPGNIILDRVDNVKYLVMSAKAEYDSGVISYWDGTLYRTSVTVTIQRFGGNKNTFGKTLDEPTTIATDIPVLVNPLNFSENDQPDTILHADKIKVAIASRHDIRERDRLIASNGDTYLVNSIDKSSLQNIFILFVNLDRR